MAVIYARRIQQGIMELAKVPLVWREQVRELMEDVST